MTYRGRVKNGVIVLDEPGRLPEGAEVEVQPVAEAESAVTLYERLKDVLTVKRRLKDARLAANPGQYSASSRAGMLTCHTFRATTIVDPFNEGVPPEDVQHLAGHAEPRTTRLYDRRRREVTRTIVGRISI